MLNLHLTIRFDSPLRRVEGSLGDEKRNSKFSGIDSGAAHMIVMVVRNKKGVGGLGGTAVPGKALARFRGAEAGVEE